jgi:hypothetical protein
MKTALVGFAAAALALAGDPAFAQPQPRTLEVPATKSWQHAATGMVLPPQAAGLSRGGIIDRTSAEPTLPLHATGLASTAVAVAPVRGWLLKVRMTSARLDPAALDARLTAFLEALRWPAEAKPAPAAVPIVPCPDSLAFKKAKTVPNDMGNVLMDAISGTVELDEVDQGKAAPVVYCREPGPLKVEGVYRPNRRRDSYVIAMGDSGTALRLAPALDLGALTGGGSAGKRVAMTLMEHDSTSVLPSFNRLPSPEQAMAVAFSGQPRETISVSTSPGKN